MWRKGISSLRQRPKSCQRLVVLPQLGTINFLPPPMIITVVSVQHLLNSHLQRSNLVENAFIDDRAEELK